MKVTAKIKLDLRSQNYGSSVYAVQGDGGSRCVEAALLDGGKPWNVPAGVTAAVAYKKPDFTKGLYDKLADDTPAVTVSGSTVTVVLAKQMLTVPGSVQACIVFNNAALDQLTTFPFTVAVAANPVIGAEPSDDYIRLQWLEEKLDEYLEKFAGGVTDEAVVQRIVDEYLAANPPEVTETDPTVPAWAKQPTKPTYTAAEVGALPDTYTPPSQTAQQVGADPAGAAASAVSQHNTDATAHNDLRLAFQGLSDRINAALDSDDTTLDQMSEVVAYIKSNKSLIDAITTSKVSVADIVNDLVTNVADKPLSAAQGVALKQLIDDLQAIIPGEGGSGIAVTGATVGQTVKIAAVDDDGVPTAWESVDFPSGGGSGGDAWEVIADYSDIVEVQNVNIPFTKDYKKIRILMHNALSGGGGLMRFCLNTETAGTINRLGLTGNNFLSESGKNVVVTMERLVDGYWICTAGSHQYVSTGIESQTSSQSVFTASKPFTAKTTNIVFNCGSSYITAGRILVEGVPA